MQVDVRTFGQLKNQFIKEITITNNKGNEFSCINYGCIITRIMMADRDGKKENIVLGFDSLKKYEEHSPYFGSVIGRVAGRIREAQFELDGNHYNLSKNEKETHLHGGINGFHNAIWDMEIVTEKESITVIFYYVSNAQTEGYPGTVSVKVGYRFTNDNELILTYSAISDEKTILNMTNHSYFNLSGNVKENVLNHLLTIKSSQFLELDESLLPTGRILSVQNTPFDFQSDRLINDGVVSSHIQNIIAGHGYDHPFILNKDEKKQIILSDTKSGRVLTMETNQPAVVLYTGNHIKDNFTIRGRQAEKYIGLCLETQGFPDAVHHTHFPSIVIEKDMIYFAKTKLMFTTV